MSDRDRRGMGNRKNSLEEGKMKKVYGHEDMYKNGVYEVCRIGKYGRILKLLREGRMYKDGVIEEMTWWIFGDRYWIRWWWRGVYEFMDVKSPKEDKMKVTREQIDEVRKYLVAVYGDNDGRGYEDAEVLRYIAMTDETLGIER